MRNWQDIHQLVVELSSFEVYTGKNVIATYRTAITEKEQTVDTPKS